jgi:hypothetical protein
VDPEQLQDEPLAEPIALGTVPWAWIWNVIINVTLISAMTLITAAIA